MKKTVLFLLSFAAVLMLAVFLSPWLYQILPFKFERIFNRIVMIGTLICVLAFVRVKRETLTQYGLGWQKDSIRLFLTAFAAPVLVLTIYVALQIALGEAVFSLRDIGALKWGERLVLAALTGILIGTIEEFFFRGAVLRSLLGASYSSGKLIFSLLITNGFYSIVHFVHAQKPFVDQTPDFVDSLRVLAAPFSSFAHFGDFWPGFVGLFIFGLMLSGVLLKTKSLYAAIGLHAGAVFFIKTDGLWANLGATNLIWGSSKMYDGIVGWAALGVLYFFLLLLLSKLKQSSPNNKRQGL